MLGFCWERFSPHLEGANLTAMEKNPSQRQMGLLGPRAVRATRSLPVDTTSLQMSPKFGDVPWITTFLESGGLGLFHWQALRQTAKEGFCVKIHFSKARNWGPTPEL